MQILKYLAATILPILVLWFVAGSSMALGVVMIISALIFIVWLVVFIIDISNKTKNHRMLGVTFLCLLAGLGILMLLPENSENDNGTDEMADVMAAPEPEIDSAKVYLAWKYEDTALSSKDKNVKLKYLTLSINTNPVPSENIYIKRSSVYCELEDYEKALADAKRAVSIKGNYFAYAQRAECYENMYDYEKAIADADSMLLVVPHNVHTYCYRAYLYHIYGDNKSASKDYYAALNVNPDYKEAKEGLRHLETCQGE